MECPVTIDEAYLILSLAFRIAAYASCFLWLNCGVNVPDSISTSIFLSTLDGLARYLYLLTLYGNIGLSKGVFYKNE